MSEKYAIKIPLVLLIIAFFSFFGGLIPAIKVERKIASDLSKIEVEITDKYAYYNKEESTYLNGCYHIEYTFEITNNTKVFWESLSIVVYVYDDKDVSLGVLKCSFGSSYSYASDLKLGVGESVLKKSDFHDDQPDSFFKALYEKDLSSFRFEIEITSGTYKIGDNTYTVYG